MSATVPMELTFGSGGNLKSARRLRSLDLKDRLNNISKPTKPIFANTGQILKKAQRAGPITPRGGGFVLGTGSPIGGRSTIPPPPVIEGLANRQGDSDGGGSVVPEEVARDIQQGAAGKPAGGGKLSTKTIAIGGGVAVIALIIAYFMFFSKKKRKGKSKRKK